MTTDIIIAGVGGQGTVLAGRIISQVAQLAGLDVKVSEIHGMSQRGGSVVTQVRFGEKILSPLVYPGAVNYILAFELLEGLRVAPLLAADGAIIVNDQKLEPVTVLSGRMEYPADAKADIAAVRPQAVFADALALAKEAGTAKAVNLVLLGWLSQQLDFAEELWLDAIAACVKPKFIEINKKAFALGRAL